MAIGAAIEFARPFTGAGRAHATNAHLHVSQPAAERKGGRRLMKGGGRLIKGERANVECQMSKVEGRMKGGGEKQKRSRDRCHL